MNPRHRDFQSLALPTELPAHEIADMLGRMKNFVELPVVRPTGRTGWDYKAALRNVKDFTAPNACFCISVRSDSADDEEW